MALELVTVPRVPILRTGHYDLQSGPVDFAIEHLQAAADAFANDPAARAPRVRLELEDQDHLDGEGMVLEAAGGFGGPAVGWCDELTVDGNTLYADLHVPAAVASAMEWAFPGRSIEGLFGYTTATGQTHDFLATGLLLLGTSWPGVTTLPDFYEVQAEFMRDVAGGEIAVATFAGADDADAPAVRVALERSAVVARLGVQARAPREHAAELAQAGLSLGDLRLRWYAAESSGDLEDLPESYDYYSWYVLETRADDDGTIFALVLDEATGQMWRFDVASISGAEVTWASPVEVVLEVVPVSALGARPRPRPALARFNSRAESRSTAASSSPPNAIPDQEANRPMNDAQRRTLAASLGLDPESATEEDVHAEAARRAEADPPADPPEGDPAPEGDPDPEAATARTATISTGRLAELEAQAARGAAADARQTHGDRDRLVLAALSDGRITPAEAGLGELDPATGLYAIAETGWRRDLEDAPEVTARALGRLEAGKYPGAAGRRGVTPQESQNSGSLARALQASGLSPQTREGVKA